MPLPSPGWPWKATTGAQSQVSLHLPPLSPPRSAPCAHLRSRRRRRRGGHPPAAAAAAAAAPAAGAAAGPSRRVSRLRVRVGERPGRGRNEAPGRAARRHRRRVPAFGALRLLGGRSSSRWRRRRRGCYCRHRSQLRVLRLQLAIFLCQQLIAVACRSRGGSAAAVEVQNVFEFAADSGKFGSDSDDLCTRLRELGSEGCIPAEGRARLRSDGRVLDVVGLHRTVREVGRPALKPALPPSSTYTAAGVQRCHDRPRTSSER